MTTLHTISYLGLWNFVMLLFITYSPDHHEMLHTSIQYMMTSWNGNIFRVTGHLCGNSPVPGEFPAQRPVTRSFDVFFDLRLNKRLSKQSWGWWFETLSRPLRRHCNGTAIFYQMSNSIEILLVGRVPLTQSTWESDLSLTAFLGWQTLRSMHSI